MQKSDSISNLAAALAVAQGMMNSAKKSSQNPYFKSKYADLSECWETCRDALSKNGLSIIQTTGGSASPEQEAGVVIETTLAHKSGEWISSKIYMPLAKRDAQAVGSAITYGRRYGLCAMVGICADDDDDGEAATEHSNNAAAAEQRATPKKPHQEATGIDAALKSMFEILGDGALGLKKAEFSTYVKRITGRADIKSWKDLTNADIEKVTSQAAADIAKRDEMEGLPPAGPLA